MRIRTEGLKNRWRTLLGWAAIAAGAVALLAGWLGVSAETLVAKQLPYLVSGGLGGLVLIGAGVGVLIADDLRGERARIGRVEAQVLEIGDIVRELAARRESNVS